MTGFHTWHCRSEESVGTRVVVMRSLISCMRLNIPYRIGLFIWNVIGRFHVYFRWGVDLIGEFFLLGIAHPLCGTPFQVEGVYKEKTLRRGLDYEEGRRVALILHLSNIFVRNILYK